jgi:hypothetical protein
MSKDKLNAEAKGAAKYKFVYQAIKTNNLNILPATYNLDLGLEGLGLDESPLHLTCKNNDPLLSQILLEHGAKVNEPTRTTGATPCMLAAGATGGNIALLKLLVEDYKANFNLIDNNGSSAYKYAEDSGNAAAIEYLLGAHNSLHDGF